MADTHLGCLLLGYPEVHIDRSYGLEGNNRLARSKVLPQADLPNSQESGERGVDGLASDGGADVAHLRFRRLLLGRGVVVLRPGNDARLLQLLGTTESDLG